MIRTLKAPIALVWSNYYCDLFMKICSNSPCYRKMTVVVESHTLLKIVEKLQNAEGLLNTLTQEIKDLKRQIVKIQSKRSDENEIPEIKKRRTEDVCDNSLKLTTPSQPNDHEALQTQGPDGRNFIWDGDYVVAYTDGACENNGKSNAKAGIGVWFGDDHPFNISKPVEGRPTNNTAEIQACCAALATAVSNDIPKIIIRTDSMFTINCITQWIYKWKKNSWKLSTGGNVKNKDDLVVLDNLCSLVDVKWEYVAGHKGHKGNEEADRLAREGIRS